MDHPSQTPTGRTFVCAVVFVDIVEYSMKPVSQQVEMKTRFNAILSQALENTPASERIIVDTGDGAGLSFLGDPEDALFAASTVRDLIAAEPLESGLTVRIGINLGPVKVVRDINGQPNIIGDGINVAQRVMSFAKTNQILVSRSYFEVVSRLTQEYTQLFHFIGSRADKHVREHELYEVAVANAAHGTTSHDEKPPSGPGIPETAVAPDIELAPQPLAQPAQQDKAAKAAGKSPALLIAATGALVLLVVLSAGLWLGRSDSPSQQKPQQQPQPASNISINGHALSPQQIQEIKATYGRVAPPGDYWYDPASGLYGIWGREAAGFLRPGHNFGPLSPNASQGNTGMYVNGRHINAAEIAEWQRLFENVNRGRYWLDGRTGNIGVEGNAVPVGNLLQAVKLARQRQGGGSGSRWSSRYGIGGPEGGVPGSTFQGPAKYQADVIGK